VKWDEHVTLFLETRAEYNLFVGEHQGKKKFQTQKCGSEETKLILKKCGLYVLE
jgi:hypothetical protein